MSSTSSTAIFRRYDSLPGSNSSSYINCDFSSLPPNYDANSYSETQSNGSYQLTDYTKSPPSDRTPTGYGKRPVPKPRSSSLNSPPDESLYVNVNVTRASHHNSCPPKVYRCTFYDKSFKGKLVVFMICHSNHRTFTANYGLVDRQYYKSTSMLQCKFFHEELIFPL